MFKSARDFLDAQERLKKQGTHWFTNAYLIIARRVFFFYGAMRSDLTRLSSASRLGVKAVADWAFNAATMVG